MADPTPIRPDGEVVAGTLRVRLGGYPKTLPELNIEDNEAWQGKLVVGLASVLKTMDAIKDWDQAVRLVSRSTPLMIDLLVAYDKSGVLGGKEWIRANATNSEVYEAFKEVAQASYPFVRDLRQFPTLIGVILDQVATIASDLSPSTSGQPRNTGGRRKRSEPA